MKLLGDGGEGESEGEGEMIQLGIIQVWEGVWKSIWFSLAKFILKKKIDKMNLISSVHHLWIWKQLINASKYL